MVRLRYQHPGTRTITTLRWRKTLCASALLLVAEAFAHPEQPPPEHSGAPGEPDCGSCHFGGDPGAGAGLRISGAPEHYVPAQRYPLTILLGDANAQLAGFQLTVRDHSGRQAGQLHAIASDSRTQYADGLQYLGHAPARRSNGAAELAWDLEWTAPDVPVPVHFHVSAVAGNDDASPLGDAVHVLHEFLPATAD